MTLLRLAVAEASAHLLAGVRALDGEPVSLDRAPGRVLARDVLSPVSLPPWNNASMDGFAVRGEDVRGASAPRPARLRVVETIAAGARGARVVGAGEAARIMTGAPVPDGADSVIRVEDTDAGDDEVSIRDDRDAFRNVRRKGEDVAADAVALRAGERIVSSNSYSLAAAVVAAGGEPVPLGIAGDDPDLLADRLRAADGCDVILTSGGVSVGDYDFTRAVVQRLGGSLELWRVRMRPGAPLGYGRLFGVPWLGLPGNPVSALVTFELFGRPLVRMLGGHRRPHRRTIGVVTDEPIQLATPLTHFFRATLHDDGSDVPRARLTGSQSSGILTSMASADVLLVVPPEPADLPAGTPLRAIPLDGDAGGSERCPA